MAYELGATVPLSMIVRSAAGDPVNASTVALSIVPPTLAGTPVTPTVTNPPATVGEYGYDYVPASSGRYAVRWSTTGPTTAYTDVFHVYRQAQLGIVGLAETKEHLGIPAADTSEDEELRGFILSASEVVEDITGVMARRSVTETASGGGRNIVLERPPVLRVAEVRVDGAAVDAGTYQWSPSGLLTHTGTGWPAGARNVEVSYEAGRLEVPHNVVNGTLELIRINWRPQAGGNYSPFDGGGGDDFAPQAASIRLGFFVPNTVVQRLAPHQRGPVVL